MEQNSCINLLMNEKLEFSHHVINNAPDQIWYINHKGDICYANEAAIATSGYSNKELKTMRIYDIICDQRNSNELDSIMKKLRDHESYLYQTRHKTKAGLVYPVEVLLIMHELENQEIYVAFVRDTTEKEEKNKKNQQLESQLCHAQKMKAMGTLAGGIAHDFNNILNLISGYTELIQMDSHGNKQLQDFTGQIMTASKRASDLVRQILTFSRQGQTEKSSCDVSIIIKEILKLLRATMPATITIKQNIKSKLGNILADQIQIHQIMMNLCTNALYAMEEKGGTLEVILQSVNIDPALAGLYNMKPGHFLKLSVSDTGCGMDKSTMEHIFDPYFTTKEKEHGTGLGLATVYGIVKEHNGKIKVYSEPMTGTSFHIFFPVIQVDTQNEDRITTSFTGGNERILFVDDEKPLADLGKYLLEKLGYRVEAYTDPLSALRIFQTDPDRFDLIISDMTMPHLNGKNFAMELMQIRPEMPVILCTGFSKIITSDKATELGIKMILEKPLTFSSMAKSVREVIDCSTLAPAIPVI